MRPTEESIPSPQSVEIFGTLGPACADEDTLVRMMENGMTGIRLNLSHTTLRRSARQLETLFAAMARCGVKLRLLIDMQGPELRIGDLDAPRELRPGETVRLGDGGIGVPEAVLPFLRPGQSVLLDDGKLLLTVAAADEGGAEARVERGGTLRSRKSLALPGADVRPPAMTEEDRENIAGAASLGVAGLMQPFVRGPEDLRAVRAQADAAGWKDMRLLAKIENRDGVRALPELLPLADEIVIARGDLGNAIPLWELPGAQKAISAACRAALVPFMVVNQMLASMEESLVPTRAEVSDIFNAVLDGAASVMVTGETAAGKHPAEVMDYLARTVRAALAYRAQRA